MRRGAVSAATCSSASATVTERPDFTVSRAIRSTATRASASSTPSAMASAVSLPTSAAAWAWKRASDSVSTAWIPSA